MIDHDLPLIINWFLDSGLALNEKKTEYIIFNYYTIKFNFFLFYLSCIALYNNRVNSNFEKLNF